MLLLAAVQLGCSTPVFQCNDDAQCTSIAISGWCEPAGYCSFADETCDSGRRYGAHGGSSLGDTCVEPPTVAAETGPEDSGTLDGGGLGDDPGSGTGGSTTGSSPMSTATTLDPDTEGPGDDAHDSAAAETSEGGEEPGTSGGSHDPDPPQPSPEVCDGIDNDLDGLTDEISAMNEHCDSCRLWQSYGRAYAVCSQPRNWFQSRQFCRSRGYNLVTVGSASEETRLLNFVNAQSDYWIGANDIETEGTFVWDNGAPFDYENFGKGQPSNNDGNEHCVEIRHEVEFWNDSPCSVDNYFICEAGHDWDG